MNPVMRGIVAAVVLAACGKPLDSFCLAATVTERQHRAAYSYIQPYSYTTGTGTTRIRHYSVRVVHVPEKNFVTFQSDLSRYVVNDPYWYKNTVEGKRMKMCYQNYEYNHIFGEGKDTTARFTHVQFANESVERRLQF